MTDRWRKRDGERDGESEKKRECEKRERGERKIDRMREKEEILYSV